VFKWSYTGQETPIEIPTTSFSQPDLTDVIIVRPEVQCQPGQSTYTIDDITY